MSDKHGIKTNLEQYFDFDNIKNCRRFLENIYIKGVRLKGIELADGQYCKMENIPEDQVVQRAKEIYEHIHGQIPTKGK